MRAQLLSVLAPRIKVGTDINGSTDTLLLPNRPELLEGRCSVNTGLVGAGGLEDIVGAAVDGDGTLLLSSRGGVVGAVGLDDVVLDQGVAGPAVQGDVRVDILGVPSA